MADGSLDNKNLFNIPEFALLWVDLTYNKIIQQQVSLQAAKSNRLHFLVQRMFGTSFQNELEYDFIDSLAGNSFLLSPTYDQEAELILNFLKQFNIQNIATNSLNEDRYSQPLNFLTGEMNVISSFVLSDNYHYGLEQQPCLGDQFQEDMKRTLIANAKINGVPTMLLGMEPCWTASFLALAHMSSMTTAGYSYFLTLDSSHFF